MNKKIEYIITFLFFFSLSIVAQERNAPKDSLNIPVILVDGIEVQNLDSIDIEDIIDVKVIKDENITKIFSPRLGGVLCITTKSKKRLTQIIQEYKKKVEAAQKKRKQNQIYIK